MRLSILIRLLIIALLFNSCIYNAMVVPIEGPLSQNAQALTAEFTWNGTGHGQMKIALPDGEIC